MKFCSNHIENVQRLLGSLFSKFHCDKIFFGEENFADCKEWRVLRIFRTNMETARTRFVQERQSILHVLHVVRALIWIATNERNDKLLEDIETREKIYRVIRVTRTPEVTFKLCV